VDNLKLKKMEIRCCKKEEAIRLKEKKYIEKYK